MASPAPPSGGIAVLSAVIAHLPTGAPPVRGNRLYYDSDSRSGVEYDRDRANGSIGTIHPLGVLAAVFEVTFEVLEHSLKHRQGRRVQHREYVCKLVALHGLSPDFAQATLATLADLQP